MGEQIVTTEIKKLIIALSIQGCTSDKIAEEAFNQFMVSISSQTVRYHRAKFEKQINKGIQDEMARARATEPLALLENRIRAYEETINREKDKKRPDGKVINEALRNIGEEMRDMEKISLKREEINSRKKGDDSPDIEELTVKIEKKISISMKKRKENEDLALIAGWLEE